MKKKKSILIVDDEKATRDGLKLSFKSSGYNIYLAENSEKAIQILQSNDIDVMLTDLRMPGMDGLELMKFSKKISPKTQTIMMTAYGTVENAVEAMKQGAFNYLQKPLNLSEVEMLVKQAIQTQDLMEENIQLKQRLQKKYGFENIIGDSEPMKRIFETIRQIAPTKANVLIEGESGTGKELIANAIHNISTRKDKPFVVVHCASLAKTLLETELFGHEKGAFTGAVSSKPGKFERADEGTLFLDEVSEIDLDIQVKLLRFLEQWEFERVGGTKLIKVDIRLITATNQNLKQLVSQGRFREDLYYRLNVVNIKVPPLRERKDDIPILTKSFMAEFSMGNRKNVNSISQKALDAFTAYSWPGNIRELRNVIESIIVMAKTNEIQYEHLPSQLKQAYEKADLLVTSDSEQMPSGEKKILLPPGTSLQEAERMLIEETLKRNDYNISKAAKILNISRRTLHRKINDYNIK